MINDFIEKEASKHTDNKAIQGYLQLIDDQKQSLEQTYLELIMTLLEVKQSPDEKQHFLNQLETISEK
jgi:hypothetical protein